MECECAVCVISGVSVLGVCTLESVYCVVCVCVRRVHCVVCEVSDMFVFGVCTMECVFGEYFL